MSTKAKYNAGVQTFFDGTTFETVHAMSPLLFSDDFLGAGGGTIPTTATAGSSWLGKIVKTGGTVTVAAVANAVGGQVSCTLDATSEKQDAALYFGDQKSLDVTKGLVFEARAALTVLPSASGVQAVIGLQSNWIDGPDNASYYLQFEAAASGAINIRSKDGVTTTSVASGVTVVAGAFHVFRIDATDVTKVRFFIDGEEVTPSAGVSFAATGANAVLQPYLAAYKPSGVGVCTVTADRVMAWQNRS